MFCNVLFRAAAALIAAALAPTGWAADAGTDYPSRPIRLVVPFPPGGGTDLVSRTIQPALSARLGQQIVIDNRGGAQGILGTHIAATAAPDGYTLVIAEIGATAVATALTPNLQFDVVRDFAPISQLITQPYIMAVNPSVPAKNIAEFVKLAQSKPGALNYGSGNVTAHVMQEVFFRTAKMSLQHIPYRGSGPTIAALLQNEIQTSFSGPGAALPQIKAGKIRALAVTTLKRSRELPDVPTLDESGYKGFEISGWYGIMAPAKTPRPIVNRLNADIVAVLSSGETPKLLATRGYDPTPTTPEAFTKYLRSEVARWSKAVKDYGIKSID
ncbi:MAG TPA: tripartite tricarboxylate transporter substrate binding protein [Burkholderiales bacterium]|nr:tripartite tricarboxylate transporter substrate binding protein [Burkholderiales bacterium]